MLKIPKGKKLILFDGVCNLCNKAIINIIKYDIDNTFVFSSLQSKFGQEVILHLNIDVSKVDSIILLDPNKAYYIKSTAAIKIMNDFGSFWKLTQILLILPAFLRDMTYDFIARNRYKWYGKQKQCLIPSKEIKSKFLD